MVVSHCCFNFHVLDNVRCGAYFHTLICHLLLITRLLGFPHSFAYLCPMELIDFILHVDDHLLEFITNYGVWIYAILFLIIFVETGLVVMPFLPGDSLLFAAGALAASTGAMNPWTLGVLLFIAAILGDTLNYHIVVILDRAFLKSSHVSSINNT